MVTWSLPIISSQDSGVPQSPFILDHQQGHPLRSVSLFPRDISPQPEGRGDEARRNHVPARSRSLAHSTTSYSHCVRDHLSTPLVSRLPAVVRRCVGHISVMDVMVVRQDRCLSTTLSFTLEACCITANVVALMIVQQLIGKSYLQWNSPLWLLQ